ncbi:MAG TPA: sigma factor-like helix-turn-helix DNA-binding protein, partial [Polyangia bacterium]|nr:sigma factor-like helix-turn-helix DNA-binding protein [Polyangia bacterium]
VPLPRRAVVVMHDLDGVPVNEIARSLSISRFGTYARLRKARKELAAAVRRLLREGGASR